MSNKLPKHANLDWLKKSARQLQRHWRETGTAAKLSDAQLAVARSYGFSSWRTMKRAVDDLRADTEHVPDAPQQSADHFLRLVADGDEAAVRLALQRDPKLANAVGAHPFWGGRPQPLHVAIDTNRPPMVALLVEAGADVNGSNHGYDNWSPLMLAFAKRRKTIGDALIHAGARFGLCEALLAGDDDRLDDILRRGPAVLETDGPSGSLLALARTDHAVERLLTLGISPDSRDVWGSDALDALSKLGAQGSRLLGVLSRHGRTIRPEQFARLGDRQSLNGLAGTNRSAVFCDPVLMAAVDFGHHDLVRWLLANGADPNARASTGSCGTALHSASWNGDLEMATILIDAGADPDALDREHNNTPFGWANVSLQVTNNANCALVAHFLEPRTAVR